MAAWPWSAVEPLADDALAAAATEVAALDDAVTRGRASLTEGLGAIVPCVADPDVRRRVLAVRRSLHRTDAPVAGAIPLADELRALARQPAVAAGAALTEAADAVAFDDARRVRFGRALDAFTAQHRASMTAARIHLHGEVGTDAFGRAVVVAQPALWPQLTAWRRRIAPGEAPAKARHRRLEATLVHLLLRAAGRPTPSGLWAGIAPVAAAGAAGAPVAAATRSAPRTASADGRVGSTTLTVDEPDRLVDVQPDLSGLDPIHVHLTGRHLSLTGSDPVAVLRSATADVPDPHRRAWSAAVEAMASGCADLSRTIEQLHPDQVVERLDGLAGIVRDLDRAVGREGSTGSAEGSTGATRSPVVRVDLRFAGSASIDPGTLERAASAIQAWEVLHAAIGFGPCWARHTASALCPDPWVRNFRSRGSYAPKGSGPGGSVPDVVGLHGARFGETGTADAAVLADRFAAAVGPRAGEARIDAADLVTALDRLDSDVGSAPRTERAVTGPWGSVLIAIGGEGMAVRSVRPEPALFVARFGRLAPAARSSVVDALADGGHAGRRTGASTGPSIGSWPVEVRPSWSAAPNAAVGAPLVARRLTDDDPVPTEDAIGGGAASPILRVAPDRVGVRSHTGSVGIGSEVGIPFLASAAAPVARSKVLADAIAAASTWGWELVASGLPPVPAEVVAWRHLPAIVATVGPEDGWPVELHAERWLIDPAELVECASRPDAASRYRAWRRLADARGLPPWIVVRLAMSPNVESRLLPTTGPLAVDAFLSGFADGPGAVTVVVAQPAPAGTGLLVDGVAHAVEVAGTWVAEAAENDE